jgi:signal transduction histidine kinase
VEQAWLTRGGAWAAAVVSAASVVAGLPLAVVNWQVAGPESVFVVNAIVGLLVPFAGAFLLARRPGHRIGWVLLSAAGLGISFLGLSWATYGAVARPGTLPGVEWAAWVGQVGWVPFLALVTLLPLWFPDGRLPGRVWLVAEWLVLAELAGLVLLSAVHPRLADGLVPNPLVVGPVWVGEVSAGLTFATVVTAAVVCAPGALLRYRRADAAGRVPLRWFVLAVVVAAGSLFVPAPFPASEVLTGAAFVLMAVAITAAVLRHRLYGIEVAVHRTLVYATLTLLGVLVYLGVVAGVGLVLPAGAGLVGAAVVAVAFAPLRARLQAGAYRLVYGDRLDPYDALTRLGARLERNLGPEEVPAVALAEVRTALRAPYAALTVDGQRVGESGTPPADRSRLETTPLLHRGEHVGDLQVAPHERDQSLSRRDRELLADLARPLAAALHGTVLTAQLQRSRERLVEALEEERHRLHRDLHDGIGPSLAALVLNLDAVRYAAHRGTPSDRASTGARTAGTADQRTGSAVDGLVDALKSDVRAVIAELRRVVYQLRPPALDELGLVGALDRHLATYPQAPGSTRIHLHAPDPLPPLPAAVEVAAYRIVAEALTNAVRHARATRCEVRLALNGRLIVEVADDGTGITPAAPAGAGLRSVRERAAELGGQCVIAPREPSGTLVRATLPVHRD